MTRPYDAAAAAWLDTIAAVSWQTALLVVVVSVLTLLARRRPPAFRYWLWCVVLVRLCIPLQLSFPLGLANHAENAVTLATETVAAYPASRGTEHRSRTWEAAVASSPARAALMPDVSRARGSGNRSAAASSASPSMFAARRTSAAFLSWCAIVTLLAAGILWRHLRAASAVRRCAHIVRPELLALTADLRSRLRLRGSVDLRYLEIGQADSPTVAGVMHPCVLLPRSMADGWSLAELEPVLLHELAHVRRRDLIVNWLQIVVQIVWFFNPLVWLVNWRIRELREEACDDLAVAVSSDSRGQYGRSMVRVLEETALRPAFGAGGMGFSERRSSVRNRIVRIMSATYRVHRGLSLGSIVVLAVLGAGAIVVTANGGSAGTGQDRMPANLFTEAYAPAEPADANADTTETIQQAAEKGLKLASGERYLVMPLGTDGEPLRNPEVWAKRYYDLAPKPCCVSGRMTDDTGKPLAETTITAKLTFWVGRHRSVSHDLPPVVTGADGAYTFDAIAAGPYKITAEKAGYARTSKETLVSRDKARAEVNLTTQKAGAVRGRVTGPDGVPAADVYVEVAAINNGYSYYYGKMNATTDASGQFTIPIDQVGQCNLRFEPKRDYADQIVYDVPTNTSGLAVKLSAGGAVTGRIVRMDAEKRIPVARAVVFAVADTASYSFLSRRQVTTDDQGKFRIDRLCTVQRREFAGSGSDPNEIREWTIMCQDQRHAVKLSEKQVVEVELVVKEVEPWTSADWRAIGQVTDAATGKPVGKFSVSMREQGEENWQEMRNKANEPGSYDVGPIWPQTAMEVRVQAMGYQPSVSPVLYGRRAQVRHDFVLEKGARLTGVVRSPDGKGLADAKVVLYGVRDLINIRNGEPERNSGTFASADASGRFAFQPPTGRFLLMAFHDGGFARATDDEFAKAQHQLRVEPWARVDGTIKEGRQALAAADIQISSEYYTEPRTEAAPQVIWYYDVKSDQMGHFEFPRVLPRLARVGHALRIPDGRGWLAPLTHAVSVALKPGESYTVAVGGTGRCVVGRAKMPAGIDTSSTVLWGRLTKKGNRGGVPLGFKPEMKNINERKRAYRQTPEGLAQFVDHREYHAIVTPDGTFRIPDVDHGDYELMVRNPSFSVLGRGAVTVGPAAGGAPDEPVDAGVIELRDLRERR